MLRTGLYLLTAAVATLNIELTRVTSIQSGKGRRCALPGDTVPLFAHNPTIDHPQHKGAALKKAAPLCWGQLDLPAWLCRRHQGERSALLLQHICAAGLEIVEKGLLTNHGILICSK